MKWSWGLTERTGIIVVGEIEEVDVEVHPRAVVVGYTRDLALYRLVLLKYGLEGRPVGIILSDRGVSAGGSILGEDRVDEEREDMEEGDEGLHLGNSDEEGRFGRRYRSSRSDDDGEGKKRQDCSVSQECVRARKTE